MRSFICIECPNGCELSAGLSGGEVRVSGNKCPRGAAYAAAELTAPVRTLCSTVGTASPDRPVLPVRVSAPVPKESVSALMELIKTLVVRPPLAVGDVIVKDALGLGADIIASDELE